MEDGKRSGSLNINTEQGRGNRRSLRDKILSQYLGYDAALLWYILQFLFLKFNFILYLLCWTTLPDQRLRLSNSLKDQLVLKAPLSAIFFFRFRPIIRVSILSVKSPEMLHFSESAR